MMSMRMCKRTKKVVGHRSADCVFRRCSSICGYARLSTVGMTSLYTRVKRMHPFVASLREVYYQRGTREQEILVDFVNLLKEIIDFIKINHVKSSLFTRVKQVAFCKHYSKQLAGFNARLDRKR
jgi:hypothetical protein